MHFCRKMLRVAFTLFMLLLAKFAKVPGLGGGGGQPKFANASILGAYGPPSHPLLTSKLAHIQFLPLVSFALLISWSCSCNQYWSPHAMFPLFAPSLKDCKWSCSMCIMWRISPLCPNTRLFLCWTMRFHSCFKWVACTPPLSTGSKGHAAASNGGNPKLLESLVRRWEWGQRRIQSPVQGLVAKAEEQFARPCFVNCFPHPTLSLF